MQKQLILLAIAFLALQACNRQPQKQENSEDKDQTQFYSERHRPQFHFSPKEKWMNDPNGMVYYDGEYHLFYQHYPDSTVWGPMHWGHAVSKDLINWQHLPIALYPDSLGYIFSGSAVVDQRNTTGFKKGEEKPLVAIFSYHNPETKVQTQGIAYSTDKGRSWTKYKGNPVLENPDIEDFRDPKVFWHETSGKWVMSLAAGDHIRFYTSPDLKDWSYQSSFGKGTGAHGGVWECPDLFKLKEQKSGEEHWVLLVSINPGGPNKGSATQYFIGDFDGSKFTMLPEFADDLSQDTAASRFEKAKWIDYGTDNYAGVTWSNAPRDRAVFIGWMSNWLYGQEVPTNKWRSAMTLPRKLQLKNASFGARLASEPLNEVKKLRKHKVDMQEKEISGTHVIERLDKAPVLAELKLEFAFTDSAQLGQDGAFGVLLSNKEGHQMRIGYQPGQSRFFVDRRKAGKSSFSSRFAKLHTAPWKIRKDTLSMHIYVDAASVELFAEKGQRVMTEIMFPEPPYSQVAVFSKNGQVKLQKAKAWELQSIW